MQGNPSAAARNSRLVVLDGLRGIAAVSVMMYHLQNEFHEIGPFARAYLFVDFFFLLSGFVLTLAAEDRLNEGWPAKSFMFARFRRLWPTIAVGTCLGAIQFGLAGEHVDIGLIALSLLFIPCLFGKGAAFPLNNPQWSLFSELCANLAHSLLLRRLSDGALLLFAAISAVLLIALTAKWGSLTGGIHSYDFWESLPRVFWSYPLGILLARKWKQRQGMPLADWRLSLAMPFLMVFAVPFFPFGWVASDLIAVLVIQPALFWIAVHACPPKNALPWLNWLGSISYPLYAIHLPMLLMFRELGLSIFVQLAAVLGTILAAHFVYRLLAHRPKRPKATMQTAG